MHNGKSASIWNKDFILLLTVNAFVFISMHMLSTTIAKFSMSLSGAEAMAGVVAGIFSVSSIIVRPICGNLIDRKKKKRLYLFSMVVILISMLGYSVSAHNAVLIFFRLLHGVGWGFATTIGMTMAANTAPEEKIGECTSVYGLANVLAMALSPNLGSYLSGNFGYRVMFLGAAVIIGCAVVALSFVKDQPIPLGTQAKKISVNTLILKEAAFPACVLFLNGMAYTSIITFLIAYGETAGIDKPSLFFSVYSVVILVVRLSSGRIVDRKGPGYILVPGGFFFVGCLLLLANLQNAGMLYLAAVFLGFGYSACLSTLMAVSMKRTTPDRRGIASSTINVGVDLGAGIGSSATGILIGWFGYSRMYLFLCIPVILAVLIYLWDQKNYKKLKGIYTEGSPS